MGTNPSLGLGDGLAVGDRDRCCVQRLRDWPRHVAGRGHGLRNDQVRFRRNVRVGQNLRCRGRQRRCGGARGRPIGKRLRDREDELVHLVRRLCVGLLRHRWKRALGGPVRHERWE